MAFFLSWQNAVSILLFVPSLISIPLRVVALVSGICLVLFVAGNCLAAPSSVVPAVIKEYCVDCHDSDGKKGDLDLEKIHLADVTQHSAEWERVIRKLRARQMPPEGKPRPDERTYEIVLAKLKSSLDRAAAKNPNPGRIETFRRLNRTEYQNAIRDLLAVDIDAATLLPKDDVSHGFDNGAVGVLSPALLDRYISAAQKISRMAVGAPNRAPDGYTFRIRADVTQEEHVEGLPLGTRGGALIPYTFPRDGEYEIQIRLARDRNEEVEGLHEPHELEVLLDRSRVKLFTVAPPKTPKDHETADAHLQVRIPVTAGSHQLGVTFLKSASHLLESKRQPYSARFNMHRHPRLGPAIYQVSINGPYNSTAPGETQSRRRIFGNQTENWNDENYKEHAKIKTHTTPAPASSPGGEDTGEGELSFAEKRAGQILSTLMRRAYRRPVTKDDLQKPMEFFHQARTEGFEAGIEAALSAILISPEFLFRVERDPEAVKPNTAYRISDLELASRLSFFLWSSIPDDELLDLAIRGDLHKPRVLEKQTRRMLADTRARNLASNFAGQWLYLRNLESCTPDLRLFPDFDDNLRQAFRQETELFFESILREDRNVLDLLKADFTFLNERLAKHYGIPHIYGSHFRRVTLERGSASRSNLKPSTDTAFLPLPARNEWGEGNNESHKRGGLLRHGSILTVTSYATRTSPVLRGKWILENILGTPPPPPLPNVPDLKDNTVSSTLSVRERLAEHRANTACASCHNMMDPVGFSLENFDAIGRWRDLEEGSPIDPSGGLPDGSKFTGVSGLEEGLRQRPELFVGTLMEKLMTFALGRGMEAYDAPAIRKIVKEAQEKDFRFSEVIVGIVQSTPFTMRKSL